MPSNVIPLAPRAARQASTPRPTNTTPAPVIQITACAVYTVAEVAEMLSLSTGSTYNLVRKGEIPAKKMGGRWVIPKRRFEAWLNDLPEASIEDLERDMRREERRFPRSS
jgi:excisionase family DNA binding protein